MKMIKRAFIVACILAVALGGVQSMQAGWEDTGAPVKPKVKPVVIVPEGAAVQRADVAVERRAVATPVVVEQPVLQNRAVEVPVQRSVRSAGEHSEPKAVSVASRQWDRTDSGRRAIIEPELMDYYTSYLDSAVEDERWYGMTYVTGGELAPGKEIAILEMEAHFLLVDYRNFLLGDAEIQFDPKLLFFTDDAEAEILPTLAVQLPVDMGIVWRYENRWSFEAAVTPGIYSDIENFDTGAFAIPFRGCLYYSFDPELSIRAGVEIRLGWDQVVMPLLGLAWEASEQFYLEVGVPRSLALLKVGVLQFYGKLEWDNTTYALKDDYGAEDLTINEWRLGGGVGIDFTEDVHVNFEIGTTFNRELTAEGDGGKGEVEVDGSPYLGVSFGSKF